MDNIQILNPDKFFEMHAKTCNGEFAFLHSENFEIRFGEINPPENFKETKNFPNCCNRHTSIAASIEKYFLQFPSCCDAHKNLLTASWYKPENYREVPSKTLWAIHYCEFQLAEKIENEDWYKDITEYFEYCIEKFGQFPPGFGSPLGLQIFYSALKFILSVHIKNNHYDAEKLTHLIEFLDKTLKPDSQAKPSEIELVINTYKEWLQIFPFEISYLSHLKDYFEKHIPILKGPKIYNRYSGLIKSNTVTQNEMLEILKNATTAVLQTVNGLTLFEQGKLTEIENKQLELINANRKHELMDLEAISWDDNKKKYVDLIKKWLADEKAYFNEIAPLLQKTLHNKVFIK